MGRCSFKSHWLEKTDNNGNKVKEWMRKESSELAYCMICNVPFSIVHGFQAALQHASSKKHLSESSVKLHASQMHLTLPSSSLHDQNTSQPIRLYSARDSAATAELIWALKCVACNFPASSTIGIGGTFRAMFPAAVPDSFTMNPKKLRYLITDALGPYFAEKLRDDIDGYYAVLYDETTNSASKKELQTAVRYWSSSLQRVATSHLQTFFIGTATAEIVFKKIIDAINNAHLPLQNLLMLGSDGPNVNKKIHKLMNEEVKTLHSRSLVDIGTCNIHLVNIAYRKGLLKLGDDAVELVIAIHNFFDGWPTRWENYMEIQKVEGVPSHRFLKHVSSRWLTFEGAAQRVLEQWPAIKNYFFKFIPLKKTNLMQTNAYKSVTKYLKMPLIEAELLFTISCATVFTRFTGFFQKDEPLVHILYEELCSLVRVIQGRVCTPVFLRKKSMNPEDLNITSNILPTEKIVIGADIEKILQSASQKEKIIFLKSAKENYIESCKYLMLKIAMSSDVLKNLYCLHPSQRKTVKSCQSIVVIKRALQIDVPEDLLIDEWKIQQLENWDEEKSIDLFWECLFQMKNSVGLPKYHAITKVVRAALILSHGNAAVERGFSASSRALTDDKASMCERTLNNIMTVKSALKHYKSPEAVPVTKKLINYAHNAHRQYNEYLEEEKKKAEMEEKEQKKREEDKANEEKKCKEKSEIAKYEDLLHKKKSEQETSRKTGDTLFQEARARLSKAISHGNMEEVQLAEAMLQGVQAIRTQEANKRKECEEISKALDKRKSSLISDFFNKKPKK